MAPGKSPPPIGDFFAMVFRVAFEHFRAWQVCASSRVSVDCSPPPLVVIKINFDIAIWLSVVVATYVGRDHIGSILFVESSFLPVVDPLVGEFHVVALAVMVAEHRGFPNVIIEGDSSIIIDVLKDPDILPPWRVDSLLQNVSLVPHHFSSCRWQHVPHCVNSVSH